MTTTVPKQRASTGGKYFSTTLDQSPSECSSATSNQSAWTDGASRRKKKKNKQQENGKPPLSPIHIKPLVFPPPCASAASESHVTTSATASALAAAEAWSAKQHEVAASVHYQDGPPPGSSPRGHLPRRASMASVPLPSLEQSALDGDAAAELHARSMGTSCMLKSSSTKDAHALASTPSAADLLHPSPRLLELGGPNTPLPTLRLSDGAAGPAPARPERDALPQRSDEEEMQSFAAYLRAEANPAEKLPTADVVWGQTERDRVYNFLLYVPYQLERLILFGLLLCFDSFMAVMAVIPLRCLLAVSQLVSGLIQGRKAKLVLRMIKPGFIYYWMKDITNEFLKMSVLSSAFEIADKILSNFGIDVLEALSGTCTMWVMGRKRLHHLLSDACVAFTIVVLHSVTLMCQALVLAVALNSKRNGLLALLIANNFVEIKSAVFKRWDMPRIWGLVCLDIVERFHLIAVLAFVVVEDMDSSVTWLPNACLLWESGRILVSEVGIDIVKHAVLGKFNDVRPGIYREFMKDLCDKVRVSQSHSLHKLLGFHHLAPSALVLRTVITMFWLKLEWGTWQVLLHAGVLLAVWLVVLLFRPLFGYLLKLVAYHYVKYYNQNYQKMTGARSTFARSVTTTREASVAQGTRRDTRTSGLPMPSAPSTGSGVTGAGVTNRVTNGVTSGVTTGAGGVTHSKQE